MGILTINLLLIYVLALIAGSHQFIDNNYEHYLRIIGLIFAKLLYFLLTKAITFSKSNEYYFTKKEWASVFIFFGISFFLTIVLLEISVKTAVEYSGYFLVFYGGILFFNVFLFSLLLKLNKERIESSKNILMVQKLSSQKITIENMKNRYNEIRTLKHDFNKLLASLAELARSGNNVELLKYIENIANEKLNSDSNVVFVNLPLIDAVINAKKSSCKEKNIEFQLNITADLEVANEFDVSVILANLFDNAIEYSETVSEREIVLSVTNASSFVLINMKNKTDMPILIQNPKLRTTKRDVQKHGMGIKSIKALSEKYGGEVRFYDKNGYFNADIFLIL
jgi:signal transduction histidine kinase